MEIKYMTRENPVFPECLTGITYAPKELYYQGDLPDPRIPSVGVIGARKCTPYGKKMAKWFASQLAAAGVQIISGVARGVDGISQRAAIEAGGRSFGILGCGIDVIYPRENEDLYRQLPLHGGILSEYPEKTPARAGHFPMRNRLISAFSDVLLVIEAKEKSGTMITVEYALEQGKDVFVLPGRLDDEYSAGCNKLARQGAMIALDFMDILERLYGKGRLSLDPQSIRRKMEGMTGEQMRKEQKSIRQKILGELTEKERIVYECMGDRSLEINEICKNVQDKLGKDAFSFPEIANYLMAMWAKSYVFSDQDGRYRVQK